MSVLIEQNMGSPDSESINPTDWSLLLEIFKIMFKTYSFHKETLSLLNVFKVICSEQQ